ncbi:MAG: hypothetical protein HW387_1034 [Parachlamydiales bacterium]|nr:hypothetical protein [Parachlamydiales bacterium]
MAKKSSTSWENVEGWYSGLVGDDGHYYHQSIILPSVLRLLNISEKSAVSVLDLGCGQGVLARVLPKNAEYWGVDASKSLIQRARQHTKHPQAHWIVADTSELLPVEKKDFDCAAFILSLQNMEEPERAIQQARRHLKKGGKLLIVLNHPCFRIPRQSSWGIDEKSQLQYRRINRYMTEMKIPIQMRPSQDSSDSVTYSFHHSLSDFFRFLQNNHFAVISMEEWCSDKTSEGAKAKMENLARREIPLFLAIMARAE